MFRATAVYGTGLLYVLASTVFIGHRPELESYSFASGICLEKTWAASPLRAALIFPGL